MVLDGTGSVYDDTGWYLVSISWYCLVLGGTWSANGDLVGCHRCLTYSQTTEYRATQLVSSIKHKLSHAIWQLLIMLALSTILTILSSHCLLTPLRRSETISCNDWQKLKNITAWLSNILIEEMLSYLKSKWGILGILGTSCKILKSNPNFWFPSSFEMPVI